MAPDEMERRAMSQDNIELNGVTYAWPKRPVVVVCINGGDQEYFDHGVKAGIIPNNDGPIDFLDPSDKSPLP